MTFHVAVFSESQDTATLAPVAAVADSQLTVSGDDIIVPPDIANLGFAYPQGLAMTLARISAPQLGLIGDLDLAPQDQVAEPSTNPFVHNWMRNPISLRSGEALNFDAAEDGASAEIRRCIVGLSDGPVQPIDPANVRSFRFTAAITCVAETWVNGAITFDQALRGGSYQIVGAHVISATGIAYRFAIPGQAWRPGGIAFDDENDIPPADWRYGGLGIWGVFDVNQLPTLDILAVATDSAQQGYLDLVRVGGVT